MLTSWYSSKTLASSAGWESNQAGKLPRIYATLMKCYFFRRLAFRAELLSFPAGKRDNIVDALGLIGQLVDTMAWSRELPPPKREESMRSIESMTEMNTPGGCIQKNQLDMRPVWHQHKDRVQDALKELLKTKVESFCKNFHAQAGPISRIYSPLTRLHRQPPSEADMQQYFRVTPPSVHQMVLTLERSGFIKRQPRAARSIELLVDPAQLPQLF